MTLTLNREESADGSQKRKKLVVNVKTEAEGSGVDPVD
jgi:hypothetical protein